MTHKVRSRKTAFKPLVRKVNPDQDKTNSESFVFLQSQTLPGHLMVTQSHTFAHAGLSQRSRWQNSSEKSTGTKWVSGFQSSSGNSEKFFFFFWPEPVAFRRVYGTWDLLVYHVTIAAPYPGGIDPRLAVYARSWDGHYTTTRRDRLKFRKILQI